MIHQNWKGIFIDADEKQLSIGKRFYKKSGKKILYFKNSFVKQDNVNDLIIQSGCKGRIGLLSIDIDGNDFWIWNAIEVIKPVIVIIEAKVEFGLRNVVVPNSEKNHHSFDKMYNGASVEALRKLGLQKGYTLIGANRYGYNLFFIPTDLVKSPFYLAKKEDLLKYKDAQKSFYPESFFKEHQFIVID